MTQPHREQEELCRRFGAKPDYCDDNEKIGIALQTLSSRPLHGLRTLRENGTAGWYLWAGDFSQDADFFQPLHVAHLGEYCPMAMPYLALPPGWRFLVAEGYEDVWYDADLLKSSG